MPWRPPGQGLAGLPATVVQINFRYAGQALDELGIPQINGALLDLGVSSHQLDDAAVVFPTGQMHRWICG